MKLKRSLLGYSIACLLAGCSLSPFSNDSESRVGSLKPQDWPDTPDMAEKKIDRKHAMQQYEEFLAEAREEELVPEAIRRLADLHLAEEQDAALESERLPGQLDSRSAELYKELMERYPDHELNDSALYQMARALEQNGDDEPSMKALSSYAGKYDGSDKYDEVQFRRGEFFFVRRNYAAAEQAYQAVLDVGDASTFHQQALYKTGWARFKQNHYEHSLNAFTQLLDENIADHDSANLPETLARAEQERLLDTLRAVSLSFAYLGTADEVENYFKAQGNRQYEPLIYANLAALHLKKERYSDAADTYRRFATVHSQHREAPLFQSHVINVYKQAGFNKRVLQEKQAFVEQYQPASTYWKQHDPAQSPEVLNQVQRHLRDIARHYHAEAQAKKTAIAYTDAGHWYELYLRAFPDGKRTSYMNFLYAELLTSAGQHGRAAGQYERTAYLYGEHNKAPEAGYAAILAYQKHEASLQDQAKLEWHRKGIDSALRFSEEFSDHEQALPVRSRAAEQLYALKDYPAAVNAALPLTENKTAPVELQLSAWTVTAHAWFDIADFHKSEAAYQQALLLTPASDQSRPQLADKLAASIYKQGEQARAAGDLDVAANHFLRVGTTVPASAIALTARYDAADAYVSLKQFPAAIKTLEEWRRDYPDSELQTDVTRKLAILYRDNKQPLQAAAEFERMAAFEKDPALQRESAWTAASLYLDAQQTPRAIQAYQKYVAQFPQPVEPAMEARSKLVSLYTDSSNNKQARYWREQIIQADRNAGNQRSDRTRFLASHAQLALIKPHYDAYHSVKLREPLQQNLARKKQYMKAAIDGYTQAAGYEIGDVTTEATYRIGEIYADFSQALMKSERPRSLKGEELEQYNLLLEEQAFPFEEQAIEIHETNLQHIASGVYDSWVKKSLEQLAELLPARYQKQERSEHFVATK
jgi:tetratricopeptide (TPR) repeat protein